MWFKTIGLTSLDKIFTLVCINLISSVFDMQARNELLKKDILKQKSAVFDETTHPIQAVPLPNIVRPVTVRKCNVNSCVKRVYYTVVWAKIFWKKF